MIPRVNAPKKKNLMAGKMEKIKEEVCKLRVDMGEFNLMSSDSDATIEPHVIDVNEFEEPTILGRDVQMYIIMESISVKRGHCNIVHIDGQDGSGKTTLARMVFNHTRFKDYFRVWIQCSWNLHLHEIRKAIISQVSGEAINGDSNDNMQYVRKRLHQLLDNGIKVLLVLDDILESLNDHREFGGLLREWNNRSEVILIATGKNTSIYLNTLEYEMKIRSVIAPLIALSDDMCWTIIKQRSHFEGTRPFDKQELEQIGAEIAKKCKGSPSAAAVLGGMLLNKDATGWAEVLNSDVWVYDCISEPFLMLAYTSMPPSLRLCFTYFAMFQYGHTIAKDDLIYQWISLGLIEQSDRFSAIQLGDQYITMLLGMSLLQTTMPVSTNKSTVLFTMNRMMHNLAKHRIMCDIYDTMETSFQQELCFNDTMETSFQQELCSNKDPRYVLLTDLKLSSKLSAHIRALRCAGSGKMELSDDSFSFSRCLRVLDLNDSSMLNLPNSICQLRHLGYLNLSGCSGLVILPESLGDLSNLLYIDLSGCSGLRNLPDSVGKLINLEHIDLSRCSGLNLQDSFGKLTSLKHVDLSDCSGLEKLPQSFGKLKMLVHLDLSFWSCFEGIEKALGGLTNLQHLNLSHPCCYLAQQQSCLEGLTDVLGKLTKLEYLNLSMFLNPIFYSQSVERTHEVIECISGFSSLEHLDLSHNRFLCDLPESLGELNNLQTLDLSGCIRLKSIARRIGEIRSLKSIDARNCRSLKSCQLVVKADNGGEYSSRNIVQLKDANLEELEISCLENVKSTEDAEQIRKVLIRKAQKLKLCWTVGSQGSMEANTLLGELLPPHLRCLELHGYNGETCLSAWLTSTMQSHVLTLVEVTIEDMPRCSRPPPLCLLLKLRRAVFRRMASITRFDVNDLIGGRSRATLFRLPKFTLELDDMENLEEFKTTYNGSGKECMLPAIGELVITKCPKLCFGPFTPRARRLVISDCTKLMVYSRGGHSVKSPCIPVSINELVVKNCEVALYNWNLLHNLPGLHSLTVNDCGDLKALPDTIDALSSLRSLCLSNCWIEPLELHLGDLASLRELKIASCKRFNGLTLGLKRPTSLGSMHLSDCNSITSLPEWLGDLTNLEKLAIHRCPAIESLPGSINKLTNLKDLHILDCPKLKGWCEREENKKIMAHIRPNYEEHGTSRPGIKDEGNVEGELEDWSDGVEEEPEAVSTYAVENLVMTGNTYAVEEEVTRDVDAAAGADACLELRLGLPRNDEEVVHVEEERDEISLRLYL